MENELNDEIDLLDLVAVLIRYKWVIIVPTILAALFALGFSIATLKLPIDKNPMPNLYKPYAVLMINQESSGGISSAIANSGLGGIAGIVGIPSGGSGYGELAVKLLASRTSLDLIRDRFSVIETYKIEENQVGNSRKLLQGKSTFEYDSGTSLLTISYEDPDPEYAHRIVNGYIVVLEELFANINLDRNHFRMQLLEDKLDEVYAQIQTIAEDIRSFQLQYNTLDVKTLAQEQITMTAQLRSQLILKEIELQTYKEVSQINDPIIRQLEAERENMAALLREMESGYSQYQKVLPSQRDLPIIAYQFMEMERELEVQQKIYETLRQQYEIAKLNTEGEEPKFQIIEQAEVPDLKSGPSRATLSIVITMAAFFLSIFSAFLINAFNNVRNNPDAMEKLKGSI